MLRQRLEIPVWIFTCRGQPTSPWYSPTSIEAACPGTIWRSFHTCPSRTSDRNFLWCTDGYTKNVRQGRHDVHHVDKRPPIETEDVRVCDEERDGGPGCSFIVKTKSGAPIRSPRVSSDLSRPTHTGLRSRSRCHESPGKRPKLWDGRLRIPLDRKPETDKALQRKPHNNCHRRHNSRSAMPHQISDPCFLLSRCVSRHHRRNGLGQFIQGGE